MVARSVCSMGDMTVFSLLESVLAAVFCRISSRGYNFPGSQTFHGLQSAYAGFVVDTINTPITTENSTESSTRLFKLWQPLPSLQPVDSCEHQFHYDHRQSSLEIWLVIRMLRLFSQRKRALHVERERWSEPLTFTPVLVDGDVRYLRYARVLRCRVAFQWRFLEAVVLNLRCRFPNRPAVSTTATIIKII